MANMTFKATLLPSNSVNYSLGSSDSGCQWYNIYGSFIRAGLSSSTVERGVIANSNSGLIELISNGNTNGDGNRGLYVGAHGTASSGKMALTIDTNNNVTLNGNASSATQLATGRTLKVNLASTSPSTAFNGTANISDIGVSGVLPAANGGTGQDSLRKAANGLINALETGSSTPVDADYYISQYVSGGTTTTTYHRRPMSALYNYIKGKTDALYSSKSYEIKIKSTSSTYSIVTDLGAQGVSINLNSETIAQEIYNNAKNCIINSSDYGYIETNCIFGSNSSYGGAYVRIFGKAYYSVLYYVLQQYKLFEIFVAPQKTSGNKIILTVYDGEDQLADQAFTTRHTYNTNNTSYPLLMSQAGISTTNTGYYEINRNNDIYANPSAGKISAKSFEVKGTFNNAAHDGRFLVGASAGNFGLYDDTNSKWIAYSTMNGEVHLGSTTVGQLNIPIYLAAGAPTACNRYAGGTNITLNGTNKSSTTAGFYAPTTAGTSGYILKSNGSGTAPTWLQTLPVANGGTGVTSAADAPWVRKSGDTMTGNLHVSTSSTLARSLYVSNANGSIGIHSQSDRGIRDFTTSRWVIYVKNNNAITHTYIPENIVLPNSYGTTLPTTTVTGQIFFKYVN